MDSMSAADAGLATLRGEVIDIILGTVFLSIGATACAIAAMRWRRGVRILVWWGIFSGLYGLQTLDQTPAVLAVLPHALKTAMPYASTAVMYLLLVSALFAWRELSLGRLRLLIQLGIFAGLAIALIGFGTFVPGGPNDKWIFYNNLLAVFSMLNRAGRRQSDLASPRPLPIGAGEPRSLQKEPARQPFRTGLPAEIVAEIASWCESLFPEHGESRARIACIGRPNSVGFPAITRGRIAVIGLWDALRVKLLGVIAVPGSPYV